MYFIVLGVSEQHIYTHTLCHRDSAFLQMITVMPRLSKLQPSILTWLEVSPLYLKTEKSDKYGICKHKATCLKYALWRLFFFFFCSNFSKPLKLKPVRQKRSPKALKCIFQWSQCRETFVLTHYTNWRFCSQRMLHVLHAGILISFDLHNFHCEPWLYLVVSQGECVGWEERSAFFFYFLEKP